MRLNCNHCDKEFETEEHQDYCHLCDGSELCAGTTPNYPCQHNNPAVVFNEDAQEAYCLPCREELNPDGEDLDHIEMWAMWWLEEANWTPPFK